MYSLRNVVKFLEDHSEINAPKAIIDSLLELPHANGIFTSQAVQDVLGNEYVRFHQESQQPEHMGVFVDDVISGLTPEELKAIAQKDW